MPLTPNEAAPRTYRQKWLATITHTTDCFGKALPEPIIYTWVCYSYALPHVAESHALHNARTQWVHGRKWPNKITIVPMFDEPDSCGLLDDEAEALSHARTAYGMVAA